jgi:hypothetical protein
MESQAIFLNCPAYLDNDGSARCGLPAEVEVRYIMGSTNGPLESAKIRCPLGHWFNGPIEYLTVPQPPAVTAIPASRLPSPAPREHSTPAARRTGGKRERNYEPPVQARPWPPHCHAHGRQRPTTFDAAD